MSQAAPTSPAVVRTPSTSRRAPPPAFGSPSDRPHRSQSTTTRPANHPPSSMPHRSLSHSQHHGRPSPSSQQNNLANVARRDFEQENVAQQPAGRRSSSRDRHGPPARADSMRSGQPAGPPRQHGHARYGSDAGSNASGPPPINGVSVDSSRAAHPGGQTVRGKRTTIATSTGEWALAKTIGAGSMGKVKLAKHMETGEQVAVKIVPRQSTDEHKSQAERERADYSKEVRTAREASIVTLINHPYICGMRDVVRTNYHWYMLLEYVNGGQMLDYIISHGRLKEKPARKFARQIASALDYCHRNSIVHRDLKIENILISKTGDIKIIDFGLSNLFAPRNLLKTFCGSLYFAAPELLQARQYTGPEVDVWSFGIVIYVLVCGKVPFDDQSMPQLHAKIKKGYVDYPPWLSSECRNLIARMLVTDPRQRASLAEVMNHPWMIKGFNTPPENFLPPREPLQLPLDPEIIKKMEGFDFGTPEYITKELTAMIDSEEYQHAIRAAAKKNQVQTPETERKRGVFDFYKRRNSTTSRDTLLNPSSEAVQLGSDPVNAFSPLMSIYYLVREKQERERAEANPGALAMPRTPGEKPLRLPDLPAPEAAYTNTSTYEMSGEKPTGGRSRPRARTHGEDEVTEGLQNLDLNPPKPASPAIITPPGEQQPAKKENAAVGLLRRFSTRRHRDHDRRETPPTPSVAVSSPPPTTDSTTSNRMSFSVRRGRDRDDQMLSIQKQDDEPQQAGLLTPPAQGSNTSRRFKSLGRSTSVNSADARRKTQRRGVSDGATTDVPPTSGSDGSSLNNVKREEIADNASEHAAPTSRTHSVTSRAKSLGHARRESIQARRARRDKAREAGVPEETDQEVDNNKEGHRSSETMKPVYLKGLFSVSTTSNKPLSFIRSDIIRVLKQLGVEYYEIKGGFSCRHVPSIDLNKVAEAPTSPGPSAGHRRRISFGFKGNDKERDEVRDQQRPPTTPKTPKYRPDQSNTNSDLSEESDGREDHRRRRGPPPAGETTTHVQSDLGGSMVLKFEIVVVKVPLLSLHGIQFKKVDGGTWQYKNMAQKILDELRL